MVRKAKDLVANRTASSVHKRRIKEKIKGELTLIVCEGTTTEVKYFRDMVRALKLSSAQVKVSHGKKSNPRSVVKSAIDIYDEQRKYEKIFVVVDVDQHGKDLDVAIKELKQHKFTRRKVNDGSSIRVPTAQILVSNPCIEVWFLLHYELLQKPFDKNKNSKAKNCKNYLRDKHISDYEENIEGLYHRLRLKQHNAFENLAKLKDCHQAKGINEPDTNVDILCHHLNKMCIS